MLSTLHMPSCALSSVANPDFYLEAYVFQISHFGIRLISELISYLGVFIRFCGGPPIHYCTYGKMGWILTRKSQKIITYFTFLI